MQIDSPIIRGRNAQEGRGRVAHFDTISSCRFCENSSLVEFVSLGTQTLTGTFPVSRDTPVSAGPLRLVVCDHCKLVQLGETYDLAEIYGENYRYRSSLNRAMSHHLRLRVSWLERNFAPKAGDLVVDIASNDGTLLRAYQTEGLNRVGVDPVGGRFADYYDGMSLIPQFFGKQTVGQIGSKKAKIITSMAMLYSLPDPRGFVEAIADLLAVDGVWHFEQSYLLSMLRTNAFDTICQEHLEYYSLTVIDSLLRSCGLRILSVQINSSNGGSVAVTAVRRDSALESDATLPWLLEEEGRAGLELMSTYRDFANRVHDVRDSMVSLVNSLNAEGASIAGYGASTKGNVTLQFAGFSEKDLPVIFDVNDEKTGHFTPGSRIPIISADGLASRRPDYLFVFPWHFRAEILARNEKFIANGGRLIFPFPWVEVVG